MKQNNILNKFNNFYQIVCVSLRIAQKIANANHNTKTQATKIASGSIHFVKLAKE
jgi:hypothetical protein